MGKIKSIGAYQVFDSRGNPTLEVEVVLEGGASGRAIVPSGASTGRFEALELRDEDPALFGGKGVLRAADNVNSRLGPALAGMDSADQLAIDKMLIALDGSLDKSKLGANALLGVSLGCAVASANQKGVPLFAHLGAGRTIPTPMIQMIGGGAHAAGVTDLQDYLVIPTSAKSFAEGFEVCADVYSAIRSIYRKSGRIPAVADEGGFWPEGFSSNEQGLDIISEAMIKAGYKPMEDVAIAIDAAASEFYDENQKMYNLKLEKRSLDAAGMVDMYEGWSKFYPLISIEDGCAETDWEGSALLTKRLGQKLQIIGDDLFTTNVSRIKQGVEQGVCNAVLIKMNQIGTLSETFEAIEFTKKNGMKPVISARSGETEDVSIVHLAIASDAGQIKVGSVTRGERTAKWNELIRMERLLGSL